MKLKLNTGTRYPALVCAILFVLTSAFSLVVINVEKRLFDVSLYITSMERLDIYSRLPMLAAETVAKSPENNDPNSPRFFLGLLPRENWETVFQALLPPDIIQPMIEQAIRFVFNYLNDQTETATLSLLEFKTNLAGSAGTESMLAILRAQPACSLDQIAQIMINNLLGQTSSFVLCNPSDELLTLFEPVLQFQLRSIAATIPDSIDLAPGISGTKQPLDGLREIRTLVRFSYVIPLVLLLLITLLVVRDLSSWSVWWGYPFLFGGLLGFLLAATVNTLANLAFNQFILPWFPDVLPTSISETVLELFLDVLLGVTKPILIQSGVLIFSGILLILIPAGIYRVGKQMKQPQS